MQAYEGVCIGRAGGGVNENFTVRKISYGEGVERVFPVHSPLIDSIEVVRRGRVRRAKLYYLRGRRGKAARIPERQDVRGKKKEAFKGFTKPKGEPDDLKLIAGVTPELEKKLNKLGLIKFEQIANLTDDEIAKVDEALSPRRRHRERGLGVEGRGADGRDHRRRGARRRGRTRGRRLTADARRRPRPTSPPKPSREARQKAQEGLGASQSHDGCHARVSGPPVTTNIALQPSAVVLDRPVKPGDDDVLFGGFVNRPRRRYLKR